MPEPFRNEPVRTPPRNRADPTGGQHPVHPLIAVIADREWIDEAPCSGLSHLFFEPHGERHTARERRVAEAKALCRTCTLRLRCREAGRRNHENGIWGGETDEERHWPGIRREGFSDARWPEPVSPVLPLPGTTRPLRRVRDLPGVE